MLMEVKELHRSEKSIVTLVIDPDTGIRYVRKELKSSHPVYQQLQHHYLPKIVQLEQNQDSSVLLEEYIDGANLAAITLPEKQTVTLMEDLCEVLVFLHQHGIIHRDIKPSNLLLAPDGHIRLIDFDAAREEKPVGDSDTRLLGTKGYAPPEQYGFAQTDSRADIYAVGCPQTALQNGKGAVAGAENQNPSALAAVGHCRCGAFGCRRVGMVVSCQSSGDHRSTIPR